MNDRKLLRGGVIGSVIAAICCFTPFLVVVFAAAGVSAWLGWADYVLFPALFFFIGLTGFAVIRRETGKSPAADP